MSDPSSDDDVYDFAPQFEPSRSKITVKPAPVVDADMPVILPYRPPRDDKPKAVETEQIKHVYLPLGLLAGGILVELLATVIWSRNMGAALVELGVDLTVGTGVMLLAMLIAAKIRGIDLGKIGVAAYKLAAISVAPAAVAEFLTPILKFIPFGWILVLVVEFVLFFALLGALFDLDESDTWYCVATLFVTNVGIYFVKMAVFH